MPRPLVISCDLSRLNMQRPAGPAVYAGFVLDLVAGGGDARVVDASEVRDADVVLSLDGRFRAGRGQRTVTAVLDLGHLLERGGYGRAEWLVQNWRVASATRRSDHLLAPSEAVAHGLERYLGTPADRVTVLPQRPRASFRRPRKEQVEELRRELQLPERYLLHVGTRSRRKNLALLEAAWREASAALGPDVGLVMAGPGGPPGVAGACDLGYVPLERLPALLAGAVAWLNPSLYEGSAVGAQEAMACGAPVAVAATGAQAKAVGMTGLVLPPHDARAWAAAIVEVTRDRDLRAQLSASSLKAAAELREARPRWEPLREALAGAGAAVS